ncbi:hypothetical protein QEN19_000566 [Hanseniaspora menglaensis]
MSLEYTYPKLSSEATKNLINEVNHYSLSNGLVMYKDNKNLANETAVAPITLFPTIISKKDFIKAVESQKLYNKLYANILLDEQNWLSNEISKISFLDPEFTGKLYDLYVKYESDKVYKKQQLELGIFRNDFLIDHLNENQTAIKEVEFNTISVSFGGLSNKVSKLHKFLHDSDFYVSENEKTSFDNQLLEVPVSDSLQNIARSLKLGVDSFEKQQDKKDTIVLFVVQPNERNVFDQRLVEYELYNAYNIKSKRITIDEIDSFIKKSESDSQLYYDNGALISVVYFRSCYSPNDFLNAKSWENRLYLESSLAVKVPSLKMQLAGSKKIQQLLTKNEVLTKFISDDSEVKTLTDTFVKIYPLDDTIDGKFAKDLIKENDPSKISNFVLKPQREGGGNNVYKHDINPFLLNKYPDEKEWDGFILMELIKSVPTSGNVILRNNQLYNVDILSELGVFGSVLIDNSSKQILSNTYDGWLLRSKLSDSNEGGVAAGFGCVDSLALI